MPISSERNAGFGLSKWERNYLKCRYKAHRNKVAAIGPAIDSRTPHDRPHVRHKGKKALTEQVRQVGIMQENLRILNRTAEIMNSNSDSSRSSDAFQHYHGGPRTGEEPERGGDEKFRQRRSAAVARRNAQLLFQWFIHKFGRYVPWWGHINY